MHSPTANFPAEQDDDVARPAKRPRTAPSEVSIYPREVGLMRKNVDDNYASFLGSASGIHFIRSVYTAIGSKEAHGQVPDQNPESSLVPGEDDRLPSGSSSSFDMYLWQPDEVTHNSSASTRFSFDEMLAWSKSYFDNWHPAYPFLHAPSVLDVFEELANAENVELSGDHQALKIAIVRSIMSISLADRRQLAKPQQPIQPLLVFTSFKHAVDSVQLTLSTRTSMLSLQAVVCVQLFLVSMLRHNAASRLGGLVTRMTYNLGLHRCPARYKAFSRSESQLRQRLFWSIYCIDRLVCQSLGLPLTLRDDDIDVCYLDEERHAQNLADPPVLDERLQLLNVLSKQAEVKGLIIELLHKSLPHRHADDNRATVIEAKLTKWSNDVEAFLDIETDAARPLSPFHEMMLGVLKHECIIALNRPLLAASNKSTEHSAALQTCIAAARSVITTMYEYLQKTEQASQDAEGRAHHSTAPLLWPSFTWAIYMSAFILIYAAIEEGVPPHVAIRLTNRGLEVLKHLSTRGSVWPSACEAAIGELRTRLNKQQSNGITSRPADTAPLSSGDVGVNNAHRADGLPEGSVRAQETRSKPTPPDSGMPHDHESPVYFTSKEPRTRSQTNRSQSRRLDTTAPRAMYAAATTPPTMNWQEQQSAASNSTPQRLRQGMPSQDPWDLHQMTTWSNNAALPLLDDVDLFQGFEIPFWMGDDQYTNLMGA